MAQDCAVNFCAGKARIEEYGGLYDSIHNDAGAKKDKQDASFQSWRDTMLSTIVKFAQKIVYSITWRTKHLVVNLCGVGNQKK